MADHVEVIDEAGRDMVAEMTLEQNEKYVILKALLLSKWTLNGGEFDILRLSQAAYEALEQLVNLELLH